MRKFRSFFRSPMGTTFLFMIAVILLMTGTIGGVRAAPQIFNPDFGYGGVKLDQIGVSLIENGDVQHPISYRNYNKETESFDEHTGVLLANMLPLLPDVKTREPLKLGYPYNEALTVYNSGSIHEYVRVTVYKYWVETDAEGKMQVDDEGNPVKYYDIPNDLIDLNFVEGDWTIDRTSSTNERTVLYYKQVLAPGQSTTPFTDVLTIDNKVMDYADVTTTASGKTVSWVADGKMFQIEVEVDAVQNRTPDKAIKSAWGVDGNAMGIVYETVES